jgi:fatty-acyl-CoA synthase
MTSAAGMPCASAPAMPASRTVPALLDELARRQPAREALVGSGQRYTHEELRERSRALAKGLYALGVRKRDKVAILMGNVPEWLLIDLAIVSLGAVMVAVNTWATARELEYVLRHSDTNYLVTVDRYLKYDYFAMLREIEPHAARLPLLRKIICLAKTTPDGMLPFGDLLELGASVSDMELDAAIAQVRPDDVAYLLYTSGSTSTPKGVQLAHFGLIENMWNIGERMHVTQEDRLWMAVSLFWGLGCENAFFNILTHGGCVVLQEHFDAGEALRLIESERCSVFYGTANMAQAIREHPERPRRDLSSLRTGATMGTPEQIMRVIDLGVREVCHIYGLTETYGNCAVTDGRDPVERRTTTVGKPLPGHDIVILDPESGQPVPAGTTGEIRVKGYVTPGYYKDVEKNRAAFDEKGYFITGDLGMFDAEGYLQFRGRIKEMIKTGGINVAPVEVEETLMTHPAVQLAYVVGVPDSVRDEVLAAVIVPRAGMAIDESALLAHCRAAMAAYKVPRLFKVMAETELPLTNTGKLQKNKLPGLFTQ